MRIQQAKHAFNCIPWAWSLSMGFFFTLQEYNLFSKIRVEKNRSHNMHTYTLYSKSTNKTKQKELFKKNRGEETHPSKN